MKLLLFILCNLIAGFLMAQDCREHLLMQKGAQLEYLYCWRFHDNPDNAVSRLLYQIDQVADSAGSTWSTIIKRGIGVFDSTKHYERKIVLQCDGQHLLIPYDLFLTDTIYTREFYPKLMDLLPDDYGYATAFTPLVDAITYIIPLNLECTISLPEGKKRFDQIVKRGYRYPIPFASRPFDVWSFNILSINLAGKENVTTPAGTFVCYKFCIEETVGNEPEPFKSWLYLNPEVGIIKLIDGRIRVVLNSIRK